MVLTKDSVFRFKQFEINQSETTMKVNSDGVLLGAWADVAKGSNILDIGSGTGLIALMAAQKNQTAKVVGVEIDEGSCQKAIKNFEGSPWSENLTLVHDTIQNYGRDCQIKFDHILSNPPFFSGGTLSDNQSKNVFRHTVKLAHGDLLLAINRLLASDGKVSMILPVIEGMRFIEIVERYRFYVTRITRMKPRKDQPSERILFEFQLSKTDKKIEDEIVMYESDSSVYTAKYKELTKEFYL